LRGILFNFTWQQFDILYRHAVLPTPSHGWAVLAIVAGMRPCQGPDPHPRKPCFAPPPGACDAHCHVFGPADRFPYAAGRTYTPPDAPFEALQALHAVLGLSRAVIVQATCHGTDNRATLDAIRRSQGAYRGVAIVDASFTDQDFEALDRGGIRAARFSFARHIGSAPDFSLVTRVAAQVAPLGWHIVLYLEAEDIVENIAMLTRLPVPIVIDHMGRVRTDGGTSQPAFRTLLDLSKNEDVWVKICGAERISSAGPPYLDAVPFARALIEAAPDRVLWGTDWPHPNIEGVMPNDGDLMTLLAESAPEADLRRRILVDNPARLYGFGA
jgi:2-pyrone-4,6-dicarboxylate lactonase